MKSHQRLTKKYGKWYLLFPVGFLGGFLLFWSFRSRLSPLTLTQFAPLFEKEELKYSVVSMFYSCLTIHFRSYILLLFFALTNVWSFYRSLFLIRLGFFQGILCGICFFSQKWIGIITYFILGFPQSLLLLPTYILLINHINNYKEKEKEKGAHGLVSLLSFFLGCGLFVLLACCMEACLNPVILNIFKGF